MLDDIRNHQATPTSDERDWITTDPIVVLFRVAALAVIALLIGLSAAERAAIPDPSTTTAHAEERRS